MSGAGVRTGTSPIEAWLYPMLTTWHEGAVQSSTEGWGFWHLPTFWRWPWWPRARGRPAAQCPTLWLLEDMPAATVPASGHVAFWDTPSHPLPSGLGLMEWEESHWLMSLSGHLTAFPGARPSQGRLCCSSHAAAPASPTAQLLAPCSCLCPVPQPAAQRGTWPREPLLQERGSHAAQGTCLPAQAPRNRALPAALGRRSLKRVPWVGGRRA